MDLVGFFFLNLIEWLMIYSNVWFMLEGKIALKHL